MTMKKPLKRCAWGDGDDAVMRDYHDHEWGVPLHDDARLFEFLVLEGAQAGLSWSTVLNKRDAYRRVFHGFDIARVARMTDAALEKLLLDPAIIRNRLKVYSARNNAQAALRLIDKFGSLDTYFWAFVDARPIRNRWKRPRRCAGAHRAVGPHQQGHEKTRVQLRRVDNHLLAHAGDRNGQ